MSFHSIPLSTSYFDLNWGNLYRSWSYVELISTSRFSMPRIFWLNFNSWSCIGNTRASFLALIAPQNILAKQNILHISIATSTLNPLIIYLRFSKITTNYNKIEAVNNLTKFCQNKRKQPYITVFECRNPQKLSELV